MRNVPAVGAALSGFSDEDVLGAIDKLKGGEVAELPVKLVELDALLAQPEGYEDDVPINPDFHARRLPPAPGARFGYRRRSRRDPAPSPARGARARRLHALRGR